MINRIKNIIIVNDYDYVEGGCSQVAIQTANTLYSNGYNVFFFCSISDKSKSNLNKNINVISCNHFDSLNNPNRLKGFCQGLYNKSANKKMKTLLNSLIVEETLIWIHGYTKALSCSWLPQCKKRGFRVLLTTHDYFSVCPNGGFFNFKKNNLCRCKPCSLSCIFCNCDSRNYIFKIYRLFRICFQNVIYRFTRNIDYLLTISKLNKSLLEGYFPNAKCINLSNPILVDRQSHRILAENNSLFLYIGRICREKGVVQLCEEFSLCNKKLVLIGNGPLLDDLKLKYKENNNINFVGWKNKTEIMDYIKKTMMLILPSVWYEASPLVPIEAMAYGIPCIISNICASKDLINDENGILFNPHNKGELIKIVLSLNSQTVKEMSKQCFNNYWNAPANEEKYSNDISNILKEISNESI